MSEHLLGVKMAQSLHSTIGIAIVRGDYDTRPFPNEAQLAQSVNASRSVTREAVKMLTAKGLIRSRQGSGTHVEPVSRWNLLDPDILAWLMHRPYSYDIYREFNQVRRAIEPVAASLAAENPDRSLIDAIGDALEAMKLNVGGNQALIEADIAFHVAILKASGNAFFLRLTPLVHAALAPSIDVSKHVGGVDVPMHEEVYLSIKQGDRDEAEEAMRRLVKHAGTLIEKYVHQP